MWTKCSALAVALLVALPAAAATIRVPADQPTIKAGLNVALTGDTVLVAAGVYTGDSNRDLIVRGQEPVVLGEAGSANTILDLQGGWGLFHYAFRFEDLGSQAVLQGFTIRDGYAYPYTTSGGIHIENASPTLADLVIEACESSTAYSTQGVALRCLDGSPRLQDVTVSDCYGATPVYFEHGAPTLTDVMIRDCPDGGMECVASAASLTRVTFTGLGWPGGCVGPALLITGEPSPLLVDCLFEDNFVSGGQCAGLGAGLIADGSSPTLQGVTFRSNRANLGGAVYFWHCPAPTMQNVVFENNHAQLGGAIYLDGTSLTATGITCYENGADWEQQGDDPSYPGGAIYCDEASTLNLSAALIVYTTQGAGIHLEPGGSAAVSCSDLYMNAGGSTDGALGEIIGLDGNIAADPLLCGDWAPEAPLAPAAGSPCAPAHNGCGLLMGGLPVGCDNAAFRIAGRVTDAAAQPLAGVRLYGPDRAQYTDGEGEYELWFLEGWSGAIRPCWPGQIFTPAERIYAALPADQFEQDFSGRESTLHRVPADHPHLQAAFQSTRAGDSILVAPGTYAGPNNRELDFEGRDRFVAAAADSAPVIIDCEHAGRAFRFANGETAACVLQGLTIRNGHAYYPSESGGAIYVAGGASPTLRFLQIADSDAYSGGALTLGSSHALVEGLLAVNNTAGGEGGAVAIYGGAPTLRACTLFGNSASSGGGIACRNTTQPLIENCLISGNEATTAGGIYAHHATSTPTLACCDVFGNAGGDYGGYLADQTGLNGNFSLDPALCDAEGSDFHLSADSPCLPAGNDCGVLVGALGEGCMLTAVPGDSEPTPFALLPAQPNPFNPSTTLRFSLPSPARATLSILDVSGRVVATPLRGLALPAGEQLLSWAGRDDAGRALPSGVYFCRLEAGGRVATRKLTLLK